MSEALRKMREVRQKYGHLVRLTQDQERKAAAQVNAVRASKGFAADGDMQNLYSPWMQAELKQTLADESEEPRISTYHRRKSVVTSPDGLKTTSSSRSEEGSGAVDEALPETTTASSGDDETQQRTSSTSLQ